MLKEKFKDFDSMIMRRELPQNFGNKDDGVIEFPASTSDGGIVEVGYYFGAEKPKNIIGISPQIGCPGKCKFCEVGEDMFIRNLTPPEMYDQVALMLKTAIESDIDVDSIDHKVSIAKTGEPLFNPDLIEAMEMIGKLDFSYKVSTIFPKRKMDQFRKVADFASGYDHPVQMQISLISTSNGYRRGAIGIDLTSFQDIRKAAEYWMKKNPGGRKINLRKVYARSQSDRRGQKKRWSKQHYKQDQ